MVNRLSSVLCALTLFVCFGLAQDVVLTLESNGDLMKTQNDGLNYLENNGINLKRKKDKYTNINISTLNTIKNYVCTTNQVIRMVVLGHIMLKWLEK